MPIAVVIVLIIAIAVATGFFVTRETATEEVIRPETETSLDPTSDPNDMPPPPGPPPSFGTEAALEIEVEAEILPTDTEVPLELDSPMVDTPAPTPAETSSYEEGQYVANASYFTPKRTEHDIEVSITVSDDVITAVGVTYDGGTAETSSHTRFDNAYQTEVIGVALDDVSLARTGGASLTSDAFNEAIDTIKQQAEV